MIKLVIGVGTCERPTMFEKSLISFFDINLPKDILVELLIIDNSSHKPSKELVERLSPKLPLKVHYFLEEKRGLVNMRNRILKEADKLNADLLALFDDDELISENWLIDLLSTYYTYEADVVPAFTTRLMPKETPDWLIEGGFFGKGGAKDKTGTLKRSSSTCNVLFNFKKLYHDYKLRFDMRLNFSSGEDLLFFNQAYRLGAKIVWCREGEIQEIFPFSRSNEQWILERSYSRGSSVIQRSFIQEGVVKTYFFQFFKIIKEIFMYLIRYFNIFLEHDNKKIHTLKTKVLLYFIKAKIKTMYSKKVYQEYKTIHGN